MMAKQNSPDKDAQEVLDELELAKQKTMQLYSPSQGIGGNENATGVNIIDQMREKGLWFGDKQSPIMPTNRSRSNFRAAWAGIGDPAPTPILPESTDRHYTKRGRIPDDINTPSNSPSIVPVISAPQASTTVPTNIASPVIDPNALTPKQLAEIAPLRSEGYRMEGIGDKDVNGNWLPNTYLAPGSTPTATKITRGFDANGPIASIQAIGRPDLMTPSQIAAQKKVEEDYKAGEAQRVYDQAQHQIWLYGDNKTIPAAMAQLGAERQQAIATREAHANDTAARKEISEENNVTRNLAIETASEDRKWQREAKTASDKEKVELKREENFDRTLKALGGGVDAMGNPVVNQKLAMTKLFSQGYKEENVPSAYKPLLSDVEKSFNNYVSTVEGNPKNAGKKLNRQTLLEKYTLLMEGRK
jgi:hypothetical protein